MKRIDGSSISEEMPVHQYNFACFRPVLFACKFVWTICTKFCESGLIIPSKVQFESGRVVHTDSLEKQFALAFAATSEANSADTRLALHTYRTIPTATTAIGSSTLPVDPSRWMLLFFTHT